MSEMPFKESDNVDDELLSEYRFDYNKAKSNRFAGVDSQQLLKVVVLYTFRL